MQFSHDRLNLQVTLEAMVRAVKCSLKELNVELRDVRLNGSAASYVVADSNIDTYNDVDLIFGVNLDEADSFKRVKEAVGESLLKLLPEQVILVEILLLCLKSVSSELQGIIS